MLIKHQLRVPGHIYDHGVFGFEHIDVKATMSKPAAKNILDVLRGKAPRNLVNKEVAGFLHKVTSIGLARYTGA